MNRFDGTAVLMALLLAACDPIYGVQTSFKLTEPVDVSCVDRAIRGTQGVEKVEFKRIQNDSFEIAPHWGHVTEIATYWEYGEKWRGILQIHESREQRYLQNGLTSLGSKIPEARIRAYLPLMRSINSSVEKSCGIPLNSKGSLERF